MTDRADLARAAEVAAPHRARHAIRLLFTGEKVNDAQAAPHPPLRPVRVSLHGREFQVIPVADLVAMKLAANRDKDRVHVRGMDAAGLINCSGRDGAERRAASASSLHA